MANVDQFEVDTAVVEQRGGLLSAPSAALSKVREAIDQPGFRQSFSNYSGKFNCNCSNYFIRWDAKTGDDYTVFICFRVRKIKNN